MVLLLWNTDDNFSICNPFDPREHWEFCQTFVPPPLISVFKEAFVQQVIFISLFRSLCWEARTFCYSHFTDKVRDKREMTCYEYFSKLLGLKISNLLLSLWNFPINWVVLPLSKSVYWILRGAVCLEFGFNISAIHHPVPVKSLLPCFVFFVFCHFEIIF